MNYKVLYRKYRPDNFDNVVGQEYTIEMLKNAIISGKHAHAYIFTGPRGTGKTSSAKIFAKALNCEHPVDGNPCNECASCKSFKESPDIIEIDAASNNGVDQIRELINNVKLVPSSSKYKVYIIDEVHMLSDSAFNALLLTLEEPPSHVVFILATTDIQKVPITILSRCQRFDFKPVNKEALINRLKFVCSEENIKITDEALEEIALISAGGMRDALGMVDQLANDDEEISLDLVSSYFGSVSVKKIDELLTSIQNNDSESLISILGNIKSSGTNYSVFIDKVIAELRNMAIAIKSGRSSSNMSFEVIYNLIFDLNECLSNVNLNIDPYTLIEIVLLKYIKSGASISSTINQHSVGLQSDINEDKAALGNNFDEVKEDLGNNLVIDNESLENNETEDEEAEKEPEVWNKSTTEDDSFDSVKEVSIDINIRINNCFVEASKTKKNELSSKWIDFMNFLMKKDRNLTSLLADTSVLAASETYALIQSKIDSTNELINRHIASLEQYYEEFAGNKVRFAAINDDLWQKETGKYRLNLKNKIKYNYIEEKEESSVTENVDAKPKLDESEELASDIFGTYEVEN